MAFSDGRRVEDNGPSTPLTLDNRPKQPITQSQYGYTPEGGYFVPSKLAGYGTEGFGQAWDSYLNLQNKSHVYDPNVASKDLSNYARIFQEQFNDAVGRDPTNQEYDRFYRDIVAPQGSFPGGSFPGIPQLMDLTRNFVLNSYGGLASKEKQAKIATDAQGKAGDINGVYQQLLGHGASQSELDHFGKMLASGELDPYELNQFVQQLPEYQQKQDAQFRSGLNDELGKYDQSVFDREKENVISRFSQAGRLNSPSLDYALTDLMGKISENRSNYLAQLSAQQYGGNKDSARADYQTTLSKMLEGQNYNRARTDQLSDFYRGRSNDIADYQTQRSAYMDYLKAMPQQQSGSGIGGAIGSVIGTGIGAYTGGPAGAQAGAKAGQSLGGIYDYYNQ